MKKIILLLGIVLLSITSYSQKVKEKTILINSKTILNGGDYILINPTLGYVTELTSIKLKYDFKTTPYTVTGTDTLGVKSQTKDGLKFIAIMSESALTSESKYIGYANFANTNSLYGNSIIFSIPENKFTLGDSDIYIELEYKLSR